MVRERRVELLWVLPRQALNLVRLPVPPLPHKEPHTVNRLPYSVYSKKRQGTVSGVDLQPRSVAGAVDKSRKKLGGGEGTKKSPHSRKVRKLSLI